MRKTVKKLIKKKDDEAISKLIEENSAYPAKDGILNHIYNNGGEGYKDRGKNLIFAYNVF